jgi:hypothetical protein
MGSAARTLSRLQPAYRDNELALYRIGGSSAGASAAQRRAAVVVHLVWLALLIVGPVGAAVGRLRRGR